MKMELGTEAGMNEAVNDVGSMLEDAPHEIVGDADIECAADPACKDIDVIASTASHTTIVGFTGSPGQATLAVIPRTRLRGCRLQPGIQ